MAEFDPEADAPIDDDGASQDGAGSDSEQDVPEDAQDTEHYVQVGKSKLRQAQPIALGLTYRGKRVSRDQLNQSSDDEEEEEDEDEEGEDEEEEFDDPDEVDVEGAEEVNTDNEIDSDDALGTDDEALFEKFTFRGSSKPKTPKGKPVESEDDDDDDEDDDDEDDEDMEDEKEDEGASNDSEEDSEDSDSDDSSDSDSDDVDASTAKAQAETRKLLAEDRQQVLASLSQAAKADADKGFAVRTQRRTFDVLLNMRIRMQKALSVANSLYPLATESAEGGDAKAAPTSNDYEKAAEQAIALLNAIQSIRTSFYTDDKPSKSASSKRKASQDTSCEGLYEQISATEDVAMAKRRKVIDRWSARVQRPAAGGGGGGGGGSSSASRRFMASGSAPQALTAMLDSQLVAPDRLVRRTRTPRSCAPVQAGKRVEQDPEVFDDADFYQLLLKELVDQRTVDASTGGGEAGSSAPTVRWAAQAAKEAKTRKQVDRKASKGRKMRFNVHEKLQNFMTAEDRRDWEPEAVDRFFSSLFGQRVALQEDDDSEDEDAQNGGASLSGEGLRLF